MNDVERQTKLNLRARLQAQIDSNKDIIREIQENKDIWNPDLADRQIQLCKKIIKNAEAAIEAIDAELEKQNKKQ